VLDEILSFVERQPEPENGTFLNMPEERRAIHAYLTVESHEVWHNVSEEAGISLSGFLEALAADMRDYPPASGGHARWREIIRSARKIDAQRRRRGAA
jgi:hypothetical protein